MLLTTADVPGRVCTHYPITGFSHSIQTNKYLPFTNLPNLLCPVPLSTVSLLQLAIPPKRQPTFSTMPTMNGLKPYYQTQPFHVRFWGHLLFSTDTAMAFHQWWLLPGGFPWHTHSGDCWGDQQATEIKDACSTSLGSAECSGGLGSDLALFALMVPLQTKMRFIRTLDKGRWLPNKSSYWISLPPPLLLQVTTNAQNREGTEL